jgi:hypothetical protein
MVVDQESPVALGEGMAIPEGDGITPYANGQGYYKKSEVSLWDAITKRASTEMVPNGLMGAPLTVEAVMRSVTDPWNNWPLRYLSAYLRSLPGECFQISTRNNTIDAVKYDCCGAYRIWLCLRTALLWESLSQSGATSAICKVAHSALRGVMTLLFNGMMVSATEMKDATTLLFASKGCRSTEGWCPRFYGVGDDPTDAMYVGHAAQHVKDAGDEEWRYRRRVTIDQEIVERKFADEHGFRELYDVVYMGTFRDSLAAGWTLQTANALLGMARGSTVRFHSENPVPKVPHPDYAPMTEMLKDRVRQMSRDAAMNTKLGTPTQNRWMTGEEWKRGAYRTASTKSAGGVTVEIDIGKDRVQKRKLRSKAAVLAAMGSDAIDKPMLDAKYTYETPGSTGSRVVPLRSVRAIYALLYAHSHLQDLIAQWMHWQLAQDKRFGVGGVSGVPVIDHAQFMFATAMNGFLIDTRDSSGFDVAQGKYIFVPMVEAMIEGMGTLANDEFLPGVEGYETYRDAINNTMCEGKMWDTVFSSGRGSWPVGFDRENADDIAEVTRRFGYFMKMLDLLLSGLRFTIDINCIVNEVLTKYTALRADIDIPEARAKLDELVNAWVGDDAATIYKVLTKWNEADADHIVEHAIQVAMENGQSMSALKTWMSEKRCEFLKVEFCCGTYVPLCQLDVLGAESVDRLEDPIESLAGYRSKLALAVTRGLNERMLLRLFKWTAMFRMSYKGYVDRNATWYYLPWATMYVSRTQHGIGALPWTLAGSNSIPFLLSIRSDMNVMDTIAKTAMILDRSPSNVIDDVIAKNEVIFQRGFDKLRGEQILERVNASVKAIDVMKNRGIPFPARWAYQKAPERLQKQSLSSDPTLVSLKRASRNDEVPKMVATLRKVVGKFKPNYRLVFGDHDWTAEVTVNYGEAIDVGSFSPVEVPVMPFMPDWHVALTSIRGISNGSEGGGRTFSRLLGILNSDVHSQTRLVESTLDDIISNPQFTLTTESLSLLFQGMGFGTATIQKAVATFFGSHDNFAMFAHGGALGTKDPLFASISTSLVSGTADVSMGVRPTFKSLFTALANYLQFAEAARTGIVRHVTVSDSLHDAANLILGAKTRGTTYIYRQMRRDRKND